MNLLRDQDRLSVLELGLDHGPGAARCTAAQRLDRELQLVAWLKRLARPAVPDQCARSGAFEAPELGAAVLLLDRQDDERVRTGELELLHHAFELDRILVVEHRERVVRQNGTARGDEGKAHHCGQLPSHGTPLFDRSIARVPPRRRHAHPCNANVVTGTGRKPRPSRMRRLPMGLSRCLGDEWRYRHIPFSRQLFGRSSGPTLSYIRSAARPEDRAGWWASPYWSA